MWFYRRAQPCQNRTVPPVGGLTASDGTPHYGFGPSAF